MAGAALWLLLAAAFLFFKENRCRQALLILLPIIVLKLSWFGFSKLTGMPTQENILFTSVLNTLLISFSLLWLLADRISLPNRFFKWLLAFALLLLTVAASMIQLGYEMQSWICAIMDIIVWSILLSSLSFGSFLSRRRFGPVRFYLWAALWILVTTPLLITIFAAIEIQNFDNLVSNIGEILGVAMIFAGIMIAGLLPFELLLFASGFWKARFNKFFRIQTQNAVAAQSQEQPVIAE